MNLVLEPRRSSSGWSFLGELFSQLFSERPRIDAARYCSYNGLLGLVLLLGAFALRLSGPPHRLGTAGFLLTVTSALALCLAFIVPFARARWVPVVLAVHGLIVVVLTLGFALACADWALSPSSHTFRYFPGLIVLGATYGGTLWADFGPKRQHPRPWRVAGFVAGTVLEGVVGVLVLRAVLHD